MNTQTKADIEASIRRIHQPISNMTTLKMTKDGCEGIGIGSRVRCNDLFAFAFHGQIGTITDTRIDSFGDRLWTVTFDTPTAPATNWTPCKTLAATANCYDLLQG